MTMHAPQRAAQAAATRAITAAVEKGERQASLSVDYRTREALKKWLESLGYEAKYGSDQRDGNWFQVKW